LGVEIEVKEPSDPVESVYLGLEASINDI